MLRRRFIMDKTQAQNDDYLAALTMCIGLDSTQQHSIDFNKLYIKTTQNQIDKMLSKYPEYTIEQIMEATFTTEYTFEGIKIILRGKDFQEEEV